MLRDLSTFSRACIFFLLTLSFFWSSYFALFSLTPPTSAFPSVHIVASLASKLPSFILSCWKLLKFNGAWGTSCVNFLLELVLGSCWIWLKVVMDQARAVTRWSGVMYGANALSENWRRKKNFKWILCLGFVGFGWSLFWINLTKCVRECERG